MTPKAFELLRLLIESAPNVVSKNEIHAQLWSDQIVTDATLVGLIKEVRRALRDNDREQRIIRTVHRIGYAFDAALNHRNRSEGSQYLLLLDGKRMLLAGGTNVVGRDPTCDIWIDQATVSRRHARFIISSDNAELEDLDSKNGTRVEGSPLNGATILRDGDRIRFGRVGAVFRVSPAGHPTQTQQSMAE